MPVKTVEEAEQEIAALNDALKFEKQWTDHLREMHNQDAETISELRDKLNSAYQSSRQLQALIYGILPALKEGRL